MRRRKALKGSAANAGSEPANEGKQFHMDLLIAETTQESLLRQDSLQKHVQSWGPEKERVTYREDDPTTAQSRGEARTKLQRPATRVTEGGARETHEHHNRGKQENKGGPEGVEKKGQTAVSKSVRGRRGRGGRQCGSEPEENERLTKEAPARLTKHKENEAMEVIFRLAKAEGMGAEDGDHLESCREEGAPAGQGPFFPAEVEGERWKELGNC